MNKLIFLGAAVIFIVLVLIKDTTSTLCYQCNSHINPSCGDPFKSHFFARNILNCTEIAFEKYPDTTNTTAFCRKIKQVVNEKVRIIRDCGFYRGRENEEERCIRRAGSENLKLLSCACQEDFCNGSKGLKVKKIGVILSGFLWLVIWRLKVN